MSNIREFPVKCPATLQPCAGDACPIWKVVEGNECPVALNVEEAINAVKEGMRQAAAYLDSVGVPGLFHDYDDHSSGKLDWKKILEDLASLE